MKTNKTYLKQANSLVFFRAKKMTLPFLTALFLTLLSSFFTTQLYANPVFSLSLVQNVSSCNGASDGDIQVNISSSNGTIHYTLNGNPIDPVDLGFAGIHYTNLSAGNYTICLTDNDGPTCHTETITQPAPIIINFSVSPPTCPGNLGSISAQVSGGVVGPSPAALEYQTTWTHGMTSISGQTTPCPDLPNPPTPNCGTINFQNVAPGTYVLTVEDNNYCFKTASVTLEANTIYPAEDGGPVASASTVECAASAIAPASLPVIMDVSNNILSPVGPTQQLSFTNHFNTAVTTGATAAPNVWYTDRFAPAGFSSTVVLSGDNRLKQSINAADGASSRPGFGGAFYNTQGRAFDLGTASDAAEIKLYIPTTWATSNKRMAGLWGVAVNVSNAVSGYPILEFVSDVSNPRFRAYDNGVWHDMGLPSGFTYDTWVSLKIRLLPGGQFLFTAGDLNYVSSGFSPSSVRLKSVILQGHNYDATLGSIDNGPGVTYDIYWDDFTYNDAFASICEGTITYTYLYTDCSGLVFPWVYTYTVDHTTSPGEFGGPVASASTVECASSATVPATLPVVHDICGTTLSSVGPSHQLSFTNYFNTAVTTGATAAPNVWYTDRYAPAGFTSPVSWGGDNRLKQSINAADGASSRPGAYSSTFYNTQGRAFDLGTASDAAEIKLYIPTAWATSNKRMAGFWGVAVDAGNTVSGYPIVEFTSDGNNPRFRVWESGTGAWVDLGLPAGFTYDSWIALKIRLLSTGEFLLSAGSLNYVTNTSAPDASVRLKSVILQGHNYDPAISGAGVTYDIYWDNFTYNDAFASLCEGAITYTYLYTDCSGLVYPWVYTYTVDHVTAPLVPANGASSVQCLASATTPTPPTVVDVCGVSVAAVLVSTVDDPGSLTCEGTRTYNYSYTDCSGLVSNWSYVYTIHHVTAPVVPAPASSNVQCISDAVQPVNPGADWIDQKQENSGSYLYLNNEVGQSFTCGISGKLLQVDINIVNVTGTQTFDLTIYQGDGLGGSILYTGSGYSISSTGWHSLTIPANLAPQLSSGSQYTFLLSNYAYDGLWAAANGSNPYTGGMAYDSPPPANYPGYDVAFRTHMGITDVCGNVIPTPTPVASGTLLPCGGTKIYTYSYIDCASLSSNYVFTYNINNTIAPVITGSIAPSNVTGCSASNVPASVTTVADLELMGLVISDDCTPDGSLVVTSNDVPSGTCPIVVTRTYTVKDACNNATTYDQTINVVAPAIVFNCAIDKTEVACQTQGTIQASYDAWLLTTTASGGCNGSLANNAPPLAPLACGGSVNVTWTYTSSCAPLTTSCTKTFTVTNASAPVITCPGDVTVNQHDARDPYSTGYATATNCSTPTVITYDDDRSHLTSCNSTGYITRTWTATNSCNMAATCSQTITVTDVDDPIITCPSNITQVNDLGLCSAVVNFTSTALDFGYFQGFEDAAWLSGTFQNAPSTDWNNSNSIVTRVPSGTDGITSKTGTAHAVINSTVLPSSPDDYSGAFNRLGGYNSTFGLGFIAKTDVYFDVSDASLNPTTYGWDLSVAVSNQSGAHLRDFIYHVSGDNAGIYVGSDNNTNFTRQSPAYIITQPHAIITTSGWYTMEWDARNNAGNLAMDFNLRDASGTIVWTKTINTADNIASTVGGNRYMWFTFVAADKLAVDNSSLQRKLTVASTPASASTFNVGTTTVTSTTVDACGRTASCNFDVIVTDSELPVISTCAVTRSIEGCGTSSITGPDFQTNLTSSFYNVFNDATNQGIVTDNCTITSVSYQDVISNASCPITVTRTWILKDAANNTATCNQTIDVVAPAVNFTCANDKTEVACQTQVAIQASYDAWLLTTTASGGCNGSLTNNAPSLAPLACGGSVNVTWTYTSSCAPLTTSCTKTFTVTNASAPVITCPGNVTVNQHDARDPYSTGYATATNCSTPTVITYDDDRSHLTSCNSTGYITRTWTATNSCNMVATCSQTITVTDVDDPIITCPSNITQVNDLGLCSAVVNFTSTALDFGYFQGFENAAWLSGTFPNAPSTDWNNYNSVVTRVPSGTDGITSKTGGSHAVINSTVLPASPNDYTGAFNRLGGYNSTFGLGFIAKTDVYFDVNDASSNPSTYGWDLSVAVNNQSGAHLRDFIYHVSGDNAGIYVGSDNNSNFTRQSPAYIISQPHASITTSGWYTMEWDARNNAGNLAMDFNLRDASGTIVWTKTINTADDIASTVGGNRYMWFTFIAADKLAVDNSSLQRKLPVTSTPASASTFNVGTTTVTSTTVDACGRTASCNFDVTITDSELPVISTCAVTRSIEGCSTSAITGPSFNLNSTASSYNEFHDATNQGIATDNCAITSVSYQDAISNASCPITVTRTWVVKDAANNTATCNQTINVTAPTVIFNCASTQTENACQTQTAIDDAFATWLGTTTASGGCNGSLVTVPANPTAPLACGGSTTVTWNYTSSCDVVHTCTKTFTVTDESAITFTCGTDVTIAACTNQATINAQWASFLASTTASNGCNGILTNNAPLSPPSACGGSNTAVTWTYTTSCSTTSCTKNFIVTAPPISGITLTARALLLGAYVQADTLMHDSLRVLNLIPTSEPYTSMPADAVVLEAGGEQIGNGVPATVSAMLAVTGPQAIVDWVYIEVRMASSPNSIYARKRALIRRDGRIVSHTDGVSPVYFPNVCQGDYFVVIKHRNHLAAMTDVAVTLNGCVAANVDFTTSSPVYTVATIAALYNQPRKLVGTRYTLWSADANHNKNVRYNGLSNDKQYVLNAVGGSGVPNNSTTGYRIEDLNMDGKVRYNNTDNDRVVIINNVGTATPNNTLYQHTPN